ncbi:MAG TPA: DUF6702 family protein [Pyrinomonadaceae bacterium]|jgi:hypothetical protein|nr:DUF6702 family protein [Pyrinomonadaceae bacterium]
MSFNLANLLTARAFVGALVLLMCASSPVAAHKFHTSFAEADYNAKERALQITLRTFPDDLTNILTRRTGKPVSLDDKQRAASLTFAYLQEVFQLKDARGRTVRLAWVGMEAGVDNVWLYFEAKLPAGVAGARLSDRWLSDLYEDQINLVNIRNGEQKLALTFERGTGFQTIKGN